MVAGNGIWSRDCNLSCDCVVVESLFQVRKAQSSSPAVAVTLWTCVTVPVFLVTFFNNSQKSNQLLINSYAYCRNYWDVISVVGSDGFEEDRLLDYMDDIEASCSNDLEVNIPSAATITLCMDTVDRNPKKPCQLVILR